LKTLVIIKTYDIQRIKILLSKELYLIIVRTKENSMKEKGVPEKYRVWVEARKRFKLSDAQIQMARELGMNPKKFGSLANNDQEHWKAPLGEFIEELYQKHFRKAAPDVVWSIEEMEKAERTKKELRKARKQAKAPEAEANTTDDKRGKEDNGL